MMEIVELKQTDKENLNNKKAMSVPELRFPEFADKWKKVLLKDVVKFISTNSFSRSLLNYETGSIKNIHYGDIHTKFNSNFDITVESVPYINEEVDVSKILDENFCRVGDLIIADASEDYKDIGKSIEIINLNNEKLVAGLHTYIARDIYKTATGFKSYIFQTPNIRLQLMKLATGISVLGISKGNLGKVSLHTPSLPEQQKIASFLTAVDTKIQQLTKKKELLEQYKKGVMQQIFFQKIRFKDGNGNHYPEWEEKMLGEICNIKRGASPRPISSSKWFDKNSKVGWVRISDVTKSKKFLKKTEQYLSNEGIKKSRFIPRGNMIMSICASIGKPIYTNFDVCIHDGFVVFEELKANKEYLYYFLQKIEKKWYKYGQPGIQLNLNTEIVSNEIILLPNLDEQEKIACFLSQLDKKIDFVEDQLIGLAKFKKGLLQQMFV